MDFITDQQLEHLLSFIGFGRLEADTWFLGMEEGGGGEENIRTRLKFEVVEDNMHAHELLGIHDWHWGKRKIQPTWRGMCYLMLRLNGEIPDREKIRTYQAEELGRSHGDTFLCELMPLPKTSLSEWEYKTLFPQFHSPEEYYKRIKPRRIQMYRKLVKQYHPKRIVAYGKHYWEDYQSIFKGTTFRPTGKFLCAESDGSMVVLTAHFTARTMNHQWDTLAELIS
jgi:hypothetical protein